MLDAGAERILTDNVSDTYGFEKTGERAWVSWRGHAAESLRDVWVDALGDRYVMEPGLGRFTRLDSGSDLVASWEADDGSPRPWTSLGGCSVVRPRADDPGTVEFLEVRDPTSFTQRDALDAYRAYLWTVDVGDVDLGRVAAVLEEFGHIDTTAGTVDFGIAREVGCGGMLTGDSLRQVVDYLGDALIAAELVAALPSECGLPQTYHDGEAAWNMCYADAHDPSLRDWGSLSASELMTWMTALGCGRHAPRTTAEGLIASGVEGTIYVLAASRDEVAGGLAFESMEAMGRYLVVTGMPGRGLPYATVDVASGREWAADARDAHEVLAAAEVRLHDAPRRRPRR